MAPGESVTLRCVLWHAPEDGVPQDVLQRLRERRVHASMVTDPYAAMAAACRPLRPDEPGYDAPAVLLLVRPENLPRVGEVVLCLQLYAPEVVPWAYEEKGSESLLRAVTRDDIAAWTFAEDRRLERFAPPPPEERSMFLRLVRPDEDDAPDDPDPSENGDDAPPLDPDEIGRLLNEETPP